MFDTIKALLKTLLYTIVLMFPLIDSYYIFRN